MSYRASATNALTKLICITNNSVMGKEYVRNLGVGLELA